MGYIEHVPPFLSLSMVNQSHLTCNNPIDCVDDDAMYPANMNECLLLNKIWAFQEKNCTPPFC